MTKFAWAVFVVVLSTAKEGIQCPHYTCEGGYLLPGTVCLGYNSTIGEHVLSPCSSNTQTCPNPAEWGEGILVSCVDWVTRKAFSSDTYEDYYDAQLLANVGDLCDVTGVANICDYSEGMVCQCPNFNCTCALGQLLGDACNSTSLCTPGYTCNNSTCVEMYSLPAGTSATTELACEGGGPLTTNFFSSTCRATSHTVGGIPRICSSDTDCAGTDNTFTECICGLNDNQHAYCKLHYNDEPMVQFRKALSTYAFADSVYYHFMVKNYPYFQGAVPSCLRNVWRDYGEFKRQLSSAGVLGTVMWGLIG